MTQEEFMKKWIPTIVTLAATLVSAFTPAIKDALSHHPEAAAFLAGIYAIVKGLLPSPIDISAKQG